MIRFICSSNLFEEELRNIIDFEIDYLSPHEGILYIAQEDLPMLDLFCLQMAQERGITLTCLDCYGQDELTTSALRFAVQLSANKVHRLSTVLMVAIMRKDEAVTLAITQWLNGINSSLLDFGKAYVENDGNGLKTATRLYVHRNTINNRLAEFLDETQMDLREFENLKAFSIMQDYQFYS